jgi:predicted transcriptional regulator
MRPVRISEDIIPISEFKAQATECPRCVAESARFVAAVEEGIADADAGLLRDHDEVGARMRARFGRKRGG